MPEAMSGMVPISKYRKLQQLLLKYIEHVGSMEGVTFLSDEDNEWTDEELDLFEKAGYPIRAERSKTKKWREEKKRADGGQG